MTVPARVVVVGDLAVDVVARHRGPLAQGSDTPASVRTTGGGAGGNVAAWLAYLGVPVALVARVGDDAAGRAQVGDLATAGVDVTPVVVDGEAPTACVVVLVGPDGERTMLPDRGAGLALSPADIPGIGARTHVHVSGYTLLDDRPRAAALQAISAARAAGATVSVDPASAAPLSRVGAAAFLGWTGGADLLLPNLDEARVLSGRSDPFEAAAALSGRYGAVAVTLGAGGALWATGGAVEHCPAAPVEVVDTTGAGDAFCAGALARWIDGGTAVGVLRAGVATAALAVARPGARPAPA